MDIIYPKTPVCFITRRSGGSNPLPATIKKEIGFMPISFFIDIVVKARGFDWGKKSAVADLSAYESNI